MAVISNPSSRQPNVGSNFSYECHLVHFLSDPADVGADISISRPNIHPNRLHIGDIVTSDRITFERTLEIRPVSAGDAGNYHCTGTILSSIKNPLVTAQTKSLSHNITIYSE